MKTTLRTILACALFLFPLFIVHAEPPDRPEDRILRPGRAMKILFGPFAGIDYNIHRGRFVTTQNQLLCCEFEEGDGIGLAAGLKAFIPLSDAFYLSPRILYENRGGDFTATLQHYPIRGLNNTIEYVELENKLAVSLHTLTLDALVALKVTSFGLYVAAGPSVGFTLSNNFRKTETIVSPPGVYYVTNGERSQEVFNGSYDIVSTAGFALRGGVGLLYPVSNSITVNPEVLFGYSLTKVSSEHDWKAHCLQATIGVLFAL
jgi:hypothetical protein